MSTYKQFLAEQMSSETRLPWQLRLEQAFKAVPSYKGSMFAALAHFVAWTQAEEHYLDENGYFGTEGHYDMPVREYLENTAEYNWNTGKMLKLNVQAALTLYVEEKPEVVTQWLNEYLREYNEMQSRMKQAEKDAAKAARLAARKAKKGQV